MAKELKLKMRKQSVLKAAKLLFAQNGIENTTIQDIADAAQIGVASVYRYFTNKPTIAVHAAIDLWKEWNTALEEAQFTGKNGLENVEQLISAVIAFFSQNPDFLRYVDRFDTYISSMEQIPKEMIDYQNIINRKRPLIISLVTMGLQDGSIRPSLDMEDTLNTIMHTLLCLAQKIFLRGNIIPQDSDTTSEKELLILKEMIINYIKA